MMLNAIAYCTFLAFPIAGFILQGNSPGHVQGPAGNVLILNFSRFFLLWRGVISKQKRNETDSVKKVCSLNRLVIYNPIF